MLCEKCGIREANIKYTEVFNGVKTEHNLCAQCAKEMDLGPYSALIEGEFPLGKLLSSLSGLTDASASQAPKEDVICPTCGTTYEEFIKNSRFGCADCYHVFDPLLGEKIKEIAGKIRAIPANIRRSSRAVRRLQSVNEERRTGIQPGRAD
ncbi:MAG: excinuclease ABC subunit B [Clostridium fessum]